MEDREIKMLPACPVETTLTLISDKWKVLILRDLMTGTKRFGELKKSIGHVSQKGTDNATPSDGGERPAQSKGLRRGSAARGIYADRTGMQSEACYGCHVGVGSRVSETTEGGRSSADRQLNIASLHKNIASEAVSG